MVRLLLRARNDAGSRHVFRLPDDAVNMPLLRWLVRRQRQAQGAVVMRCALSLASMAGEDEHIHQLHQMTGLGVQTVGGAG